MIPTPHLRLVRRTIEEQYETGMPGIAAIDKRTVKVLQQWWVEETPTWSDEPGTVPRLTAEPGIFKGEWRDVEEGERG